MMNMDDTLRKIDLFSELADQQLEKLQNSMLEIQLHQDQTLFDLWHPSHHFFVLLEGRMLLYHQSAGPRRKVIDIIEPLRVFGASEMFLEETQPPVEAVAFKPCRVLVFDNAALLELLGNSPETGIKLMKELSRDLHRRILEIGSLYFQDATKRLAAHLMEKLPPGPGRRKTYRLGVPKWVLASRLSIEPESFSRILKKLTEQGVIQVEKNLFRILNYPALEALGAGTSKGG